MDQLALALGIGVQNFPEGAAIALPLQQEGMSRRREFIIFVVLSVIGLALNDGIVLALNAGLGLEANIAKICATALVMVYNFVTRKIFLEGEETK